MNFVTELILDRKKFRKNISYLKKRTKSSFFCPMVKANAYGVGDTLVVEELLEAGVKHVGVARVEEGLKLRRFFPNKDFEILVFQPLFKDHVGFYKSSNLTPVICSFREFQVFLESGLEKPVHLKFDLGMNRFGFELDDAEKLSKLVKESNIKVEGICGHFQTGQDWKFESIKSKSRTSLEELSKIKKLYFDSADFIHAPNSDALLAGEFEVGLRPGLCMYYTSLEDSKIQNALTLKSPIVEIRSINKGQGVSYNSTWVAEKMSKIAVLPIGYADGLSRQLSSKISLNSGNNSFPLVGAICMDYCMVDIGLDSDLRVGDYLDFFGPNMKEVANWSELLNTIPYEILTSLGLRIKRSVV